MLAGVPSGPKAATAAGHIGAASKAQRAPVSAVDYVAIMDAAVDVHPAPKIVPPHLCYRDHGGEK